jgi:hypothetical protein
MHKLDRSLIQSQAIAAIATTGLTWTQLLMLAINFGKQYGPELISVVSQVVIAVKAGDVMSLAALAVKFGPDIEAMAQQIASWFGITLPPLPAPAV